MMKHANIMLNVMNDVITPEDAVEEVRRMSDTAVYVQTPFDDMVVVTWESGHVDSYDGLQLAREWAQTPDKDAFRQQYGFDWKLSETLIRKVEEERERRQEER